MIKIIIATICVVVLLILVILTERHKWKDFQKEYNQLNDSQVADDPKFAVGQVVWFIDGNQIRTFKITKIVAFMNAEKETFVYYCRYTEKQETELYGCYYLAKKAFRGGVQ